MIFDRLLHNNISRGGHCSLNNAVFTNRLRYGQEMGIVSVVVVGIKKKRFVLIN